MNSRLAPSALALCLVVLPACQQNPSAGPNAIGYSNGLDEAIVIEDERGYQQTMDAGEFITTPLGGCRDLAVEVARKSSNDFVGRWEGSLCEGDILEITEDTGVQLLDD